MRGARCYILPTHKLKRLRKYLANWKRYLLLQNASKLWWCAAARASFWLTFASCCFCGQRCKCQHPLEQGFTYCWEEAQKRKAETCPTLRTSYHTRIACDAYHHQSNPRGLHATSLIIMLQVTPPMPGLRLPTLQSVSEDFQPDPSLLTAIRRPYLPIFTFFSSAVLMKISAKPFSQPTRSSI